MTYRRDPGDSTPALEVIEIAPTSTSYARKRRKLVAALERRDACAERDSLCQGQTLLDIQLHYKTIPCSSSASTKTPIAWPFVGKPALREVQPSRPASAPPCATSRPPSWCWWSAR